MLMVATERENGLGRLQCALTIEEHMKHYGFTIPEIAEGTGLSYTAVSRAIYGAPGHHRVHQDTVKIIAKFLGITPNSVRWPYPQTHVGRPPLARTERRTVPATSPSVTSPCCFVELTPDGHCTSCGASIAP